MNQEPSSYIQVRGYLQAIAFLTFLVLTLLGYQANALLHSHDGDLSHHVDCSICVKHVSEPDFLVSDIDVLQFVRFGVALSITAAATIIAVSLAPNSRSPPLL